MEAEKKYTLGDIIFGTREEYLKIQEKLERLKSLCIVEDETVEDFRFFLDNQRTPLKLKCLREENFDFLGNIKKFLIRRFHKYYLSMKNIANVEQQENGDINISNSYYSVIVPDENLEEFNKIIGELSEIELTKGLIEAYLSSTNKNSNTENYDNLYMNFNTIYYFTNLDDNAIDYLFYDPKGDYIYVSSFKKHKKIKTSDIKSLLNIEFNSENIAKHHQNIIDNNISLKKNLILNDTDVKARKLKLNIAESQDNLVLTKTKYKRKFL